MNDEPTTDEALSPVSDPFGDERVLPVAVQPRRTPKWPFVLVGLFFLVGILVLALWPVKVPYYAMSPGPVEEVADLITIHEVGTYEPTGELYLLTVGLREVNAFEWLEAQFDDKVDLIDRDVIRPPGTTQEEVTRRNLQSMDASIETAVVVALTRSGYEVGFNADLGVTNLSPGSPAEEVLEIGDIVETVSGRPVDTPEEAAGIIRSFQVGDTVELTGQRDGEPFAVTVTLVPHTELEDTPMVGVVFQYINVEFDLPIDVIVDSRSIGGPSAGMMYALTIMDLLSEDDLTKGHRIAGTGSINVDESVGAIGGVRQKVFAARAIGAEYVLVPEPNYEDALTATGGEIEVVPVNTLQDALDFLDSLEPAAAEVTAAG
jgi:PDZ domain-containing protein